MPPRPLRIAFVDYVCDPARPGKSGLSDLVWDMASRLAEGGDDVYVVAPYQAQAPVPDERVTVERFPLPPINYRNILGHLLIILAACRRLSRLADLDVIHVPEYLSAPFLATSQQGTPVVFTEPGNIYERVAHGNPYDWPTTLAYKMMARWTAKTCARLIATSQAMAGWWRWTGVQPDCIALVPLGVDTALFRRIPDARARLGWSPSSPRVLYASRLSRENGVDVALRAVAQLVGDGTGLELHVLGDGPEAGTLRELSSGLGIADSVTWHGWVPYDDLPTYYSAADVFVFAGLSGGTPRVLLQAMACGAPVVASAIGGIVDHLVDGSTGLLFPAGGHVDLASAIKRLLSDPQLARQLGGTGEVYARSTVDWDVLTARIRREVYPAAIATKRRRWLGRVRGMRDRHFGTIGAADDEGTLSRIYDEIGENTALYPSFYRWVLGKIVDAGVDQDARLVDVGCGAGHMLGWLRAAGFRNLAGADFSAGEVALARRRVPEAEIWQHNIVHGPIEPADAILLSEVVEHLTDPQAALRNIRQSLRQDGLLVLTFPNRWAFWPWYYLNWFYSRLPPGRLKHWFGWFTIPYEMRSTQPLDHAYSVADLRRFLQMSGFTITAEHGFRLFPMLRIHGLEWTETTVSLLERKLGRLFPKRMFYRYMFICRPDARA